MKNLAAGALAVAARLPQSALQAPVPNERTKKGEMFYRRLGRTGFLVSEI